MLFLVLRFLRKIKAMTNKFFKVFFLLFPFSLFGYECKVSNDVLLLILNVEKHKNKEIGYPYLISFNNKGDSRILKKTSIGKYFIDSRTIDCKKDEICVDITKTLLEVGINNLDLGAFQINAMYHHLDISDYFDIKKSYKFACGIISNNIRKHGFSLESIARYHSETKKYNIAYQKGLIKSYEVLMGE